VKKAVLQEIVQNIQQHTGIDPNDVMILFIETPRENWAFYNGVQLYTL
jgi:phenylpyruvate tautomerase PptA (4-oxalocrotonate tautomerase family)